MANARIELVEPRRLLSFTPFGAEGEVTPTGLVELDSDVAVEADGRYLVAKIAQAPLANLKDTPTL